MTSKSAAGILLLTLAFLAAGRPAPVEATWSLVWSDEFNGTSVDAGNWTHDIGTGCPSLCGWGNNELQYYRSQNVTVTGGNLVITSRAESFGGASFTSGKIHTRGKRTFLYGRIEMRAKIPTGGGMWPAFWMLPEADVYGGWAASGEIDIMEAANATTSVGGALHYGGSWPANTSTSGSHSLGGANFADAFHIYAIEWEPDEIRWYVDGVLFMTRTSAQWYSDGAPGNPRAPFDQEFYIILNSAVGGNYTGCTSPGCVTASLPQQYLVDYVRVYEDIVNAPPTVTITAPTSGSTVPAGTIMITANASDPDGSVATVEFYNGATYLGADTTAPYSFTWNSVTDGCYDIVARALDNLGGEGTDSVDITVGAGCGQAAYFGSPFLLPARIQAEDYDLGGQGVAYNDLDSGNSGGQYRPAEGVDIEACTDSGGGHNVGWVNAGEWLEYTVDVPAAGPYVIDVRVASASTGGALHVEFNGTDVTGSMAVPVTGGWQAWTTVTANANLAAGTQVLRLSAETAGFNINYIDVQMDPSAVVMDPRGVGHILHASFPNPFRSATTIRFDLAESDEVQLSVFDVSGRLVRALIEDEPLPAGPHAATWDGRDETGRVMSPGVYFFRMSAGAFSSTRSVTLVP